MKRALCVIFGAFLLISLPLVPMFAAMAEHYCPMFPPKNVQYYNQAKEQWIAEEKMNGFLCGIVASTYVAISGGIVMLICIADSKD